MALLNLSLPQTRSNFSRFNTSKGISSTYTPKITCLRKINISKHSNNLIRCEAATTTAIPPLSSNNGGAIPIPITPLGPATLPAIKKSDFPVDFKFGACTSAIQTEGPASIGGRGPSTWDSYITTGQQFTFLPESDNIETLSYEKYMEDIALLKAMGVNVYRFSISWSRILPNGKGEVNQDGIDFYNNLINELIANGIEPFVTLFHFDLPSALQNEYNGFLSENVVNDYHNYTDICFNTFGDRVKNWATFNEPSIYSQSGYVLGLTVADDPATNPYIVAHNIILSHGSAASNYKNNYQVLQGGQIGITLNTEGYVPHSEKIADKEAAARAFSFEVGWFMEPLVYGNYPFIMRALVGDRLPTFTLEQRKMVKGSCDFVGINYYTSTYAIGLPIIANSTPTSFAADMHLETTPMKDGKPIGIPDEGDSFIYSVPDGLRDILIYMNKNYESPKIIITENGIAQKRNDELSPAVVEDDRRRIVFIRRHLNAVLEALSKGVNVQGYFVWSLMDCMEVGGYKYGDTYTMRFGLNYTDYSSVDVKRSPKKSAQWMTKFMSGEAIGEEAVSLEPIYDSFN